VCLVVLYEVNTLLCDVVDDKWSSSIIVCVVVDYCFNEKLCLVVLYEVNTLLCDVVLNAFLLMEQEIRKITNLGILVPLLQHIQDLVFLEQYYTSMM
jgi:hypothetical protein